MPIQTTYTNARAKFAKLWDEVTNNQEVVIISRRGAEDVALISASELSSLLETSHLLRSPKNAERLLAAMGRVKKGKSKPRSIQDLKKEVGLE
ncbi:MAG: type II toxin-antitoxin system Phd/YefM family antitoxin [Deltaproteobacteria bacterium]|nr:type II toxin-antitoxin system Phd/YefM family antitoxin [Deltaproteobacteria bacterium]